MKYFMDTEFIGNAKTRRDGKPAKIIQAIEAIVAMQSTRFFEEIET